jgi:hypothetical protein
MQTVLRKVPSQLVPAAAVVAAAATGAALTAQRIFPIGTWHGVGDGGRALGVVTGTIGGLAILAAGRAYADRWSVWLCALCAAGGFGALPSHLHQTVHLTREYSDAPAQRLGRSGAFQLGLQDPAVFDRLRAAIPATASYHLQSSAPVALWAHFWLLPRVDRPLSRAAWLVAFRRDRPTGGDLLEVRRIGRGVWIAEVSR